MADIIKSIKEHPAVVLIAIIFLGMVFFTPQEDVSRTNRALGIEDLSVHDTWHTIQSKMLYRSLLAIAIIGASIFWIDRKYRLERDNMLTCFFTGVVVTLAYGVIVFKNYTLSFDSSILLEWTTWAFAGLFGIAVGYAYVFTRNLLKKSSGSYFWAFPGATVLLMAVLTISLLWVITGQLIMFEIFTGSINQNLGTVLILMSYSILKIGAIAGILAAIIMYTKNR